MISWHLLALGRTLKAPRYFAIKGSVLPLRRIADPVQAPAPHFRRQPVTRLADAVEKSAVVERIEQAETHALVEAGARYHIAQPKHFAPDWKDSSTRDAWTSDLTT